MIRLMIALALAAGAGPALAQERSGTPSAAGEAWTRTEGQLRFAPAGVTLPERAGTTAVTETSEFSHHGERLDNVVQYRSADGEVIGTVYIYYPALAHTGLAAFATDNAIRISSASEVASRGIRVVAAGDFPRAALRADYGNYRNGYASTAAFIKVGRWLIKLRVSAPERRREEVEGAMTALLDGIGFEGSSPREAAPLEVGPCAAPAPAAARRLPADMEAAADGVGVASFDGGGNPATGPRGESTVMRPRVPARWCVSTRARIGDGVYPILRAAAGQEGGLEGTSRAAVIVSDSGGLLEVVELRTGGRFVVLFHQIGQTAVLGSFAAVPSDQQIADIISGADREGANTLARVNFRPGRVDEVELIAPQQRPATEPVT